MSFDLEVDTQWIRRAAATLDETALAFRPVTVGSGIAVAPGGLGEGAEASAVAGLVGLRVQQAGDAAVQLAAIAAGLATKLRLAAEGLDRADQSAGRGPR